MKRTLLILGCVAVLLATCIAQTPAGYPTLPETWVDNQEALDGLAYISPAYEMVLGFGWVGISPPGCTFESSYGKIFGTQYNSSTCTTHATPGLQDAVCDIEACRTATGAGSILDIPPGIYTQPTTNAPGLVLPQSNTVASDSFLVLRSTEDALLPNGRTVGAHGIQDNLATSTDVGLDNPDLTGQNMYYELGEALNYDGSQQPLNTISASMSGAVATFSFSASCSTNPVPTWTPYQILYANNTFTVSGYRSLWQILTAPSCSGGIWSVTAQACPYSTATARGGSCISGLGPGTGNGGSDYFSTQFIITGHTTLSANTYILTPVITAMLGNPALIPLANGYVSPLPGSSTSDACYMVDFRTAQQECVLAIAGPNTSGLLATFNYTHSFTGVPGQVQLCLSGCNGSSPVLCGTGGCTYQLNGTSFGARTISTSSYDDLQYMWQLQNPGSAPITTCTPVAGATSTSFPPACKQSTLASGQWLIEDLRASLGPTQQIFGADINFELNGGETSPSQLPFHIHLNKVGAVDNWTSEFTGTTSVTNAINFDVIDGSIMNSQISQIMRPSAEGHAIGTRGQTLKIVHNWIEGAASGLLAGGYSSGCGPVSTCGSPMATTYIPFSDVQVGRNRFTYPFPWNGMAQIPKGFNPNNIYDNVGSSFGTDRKIAWEDKVFARVVEYGNILEHTDDSTLGYGHLRSYNCRNTGGGPQGSWYLNQCHDLTSIGNILRHGCLGISFSRSDESGGNGGGVGWALHNFSFSHDLIYDVSYPSHPQCANLSDKFGMSIGTGQNFGWQGTATVNSNGTQITFVGATDNYSGQALAGSTGTADISAAGTSPNLVVTITPNTPSAFPFNANQYGISFGGTLYPINACTPTTGSATSCTLSCSTTSSCPASGTDVAYSSAPLGAQVFDMAAGDPAPLFNCTTHSGLNSLTTTYGGNTYPTVGGYYVTSASAAWNGTYNSSNTTITIGVNPPLASSLWGVSDSTCMTTNLYSSPQNVTFNHLLLLSDTTYGISTGPTLGTGLLNKGNGPSFSTGHNWQNSIFFSGLDWHGGTQGCPSQGFILDNTSFTNDHLVWVGQAAGNFNTCFEGNNPNFPIVSPTAFFPTSMCSYWSGSSACTGSTQNINVADYHVLGQSSSSPFYAGGSSQANDGTSQGPNIATIDYYQTLNEFTCPYSCGSGPYVDGPNVAPPTAAPVWNRVGLMADSKARLLKENR
jgi:hypothetical protein